MSFSKPEPVVDNVDRAMAHKERIVTMLVGKMGFLQSNRGGQGLSAQHAHEVADSCRDGVKEHRYVNAFVVKVPANNLAAWRGPNQRKYENDALMHLG